MKTLSYNFKEEILRLQVQRQYCRMESVCALWWGVGVLFALWWDYVVAEFEIQLYMFICLEG